MPNAKGKTRERVPRSQAARIAIPRAVGTSDRCRATHDVPYTLRCVLEASHAWTPVTIPERPGIGMIRQHEDKNGARW